MNGWAARQLSWRGHVGKNHQCLYSEAVADLTLAPRLGNVTNPASLNASTWRG